MISNRKCNEILHNFSCMKLFTGISEVVMGGENVLQTIHTSKYDTYPGIEDNEEEEMAESLDIHTGRIKKYCVLYILNIARKLFLMMVVSLHLLKFSCFEFFVEFGVRRQRSHTSVQLERLQRNMMKSANVRHVKWELMPVSLTGM